MRNSNPKILPVFDPLAEQGEGQLFCPSVSTLVQTCLYLNRIREQATARTHICADVKDPIPICRKRVGLTDGRLKTPKHCTQGKKDALKNKTKTKKNLRNTVLWLLAFPEESSPNFPCVTIRTRNLSNLM